MSKRIIIADDEPIIRMDLREIIEEAGYDVVGEASDGFDAITICRKVHADLAIMDIKMPLVDGISAAKVINEEGLADAVILLTAYSDDKFVERAAEIGVTGYIVKPIDEKNLLPAIKIAISKGKEIAGMKKKITDINEKLESRKVIEKAKGILMKKCDIDENGAYSKIRNLSMDKRVSMKEIAMTIISTQLND